MVTLKCFAINAVLLKLSCVIELKMKFNCLPYDKHSDKGSAYYVIKTSGINPRYDICYFFDNIFILYLILSPQMITPGLDLSTVARGTENSKL